MDQIDALRWHLRATGQTLEIRGVDKIPHATDYVVPQGVRIADTARVRLGAHLSPGTTVLHEGFCNFNAGTLGASMVEGRISAGVIVDDGSDIGGGASIMGTMSGGGKQVVSIGKRCLLGANSGIGISLGDDCVVEAGCYITAGTRVLTPEGAVVKAVSLAGQHGQLFRRNSQTGAVETLVRTAPGARSTRRYAATRPQRIAPAARQAPDAILANQARASSSKLQASSRRHQAPGAIGERKMPQLAAPAISAWTRALPPRHPPCRSAVRTAAGRCRRPAPRSADRRDTAGAGAAQVLWNSVRDSRSLE